MEKGNGGDEVFRAVVGEGMSGVVKQRDDVGGERLEDGKRRGRSV